MSKYTLSIPQSVGRDLVISSYDLLERYFFGVTLTDQQAKGMSEEAIRHCIEFATEQFEGHLNLKFKKQIYQETLSYYLNDMRSWGFIPTTYPVNKAFKVQGFLNTVKQIDYPESWLCTKKVSDDRLYDRQVYLVPAASGTGINSSVIYSGVMPHAGLMGTYNIPYYWTVRYCTGFTKVPADILEAVGRLATINIFHQLGDIILGAGIASQSIGIDGLSQSISSTSSATNAGYGARIQGYLKDLEDMLPRLQAKYSGFNLTSM